MPFKEAWIYSTAVMSSVREDESEESPCIEEDPGSIPGSGRSPGGGHGTPLQSSCLENPMDRGAWWAAVHGVGKGQTGASDSAHTALGRSAARMGAGLRSALLSGPERPWVRFLRESGASSRERPARGLAGCLFPRPLRFCPPLPPAASTPAAVIRASLAAPLGHPGGCLLSRPLRKAY